MPTANFTLQGEVGQAPDTSFQLLTGNAAPGTFTPTTNKSFLWPGLAINTGNVDQVYTISAANLSPNLSAVTFEINGGATNEVTLAPGETAQVLVKSFTATFPPTSDPSQPANEEPASFDLEQTATPV